MPQQYIAIIIISIILVKLFQQKKKGNISVNEFSLWLMFWVTVFFLVVFIKKIDSLVASLGFSSAGIDVLIYFSIAFLVYLYAKLRIKLEKVEKNITKIVQEISLKDKK